MMSSDSPWTIGLEIRDILIPLTKVWRILFHPQLLLDSCAYTLNSSVTQGTIVFAWQSQGQA